MKRPKLIRLAYLDHSERNPVFWAWDAKDLAGREYHITYRSGVLTVSGPDVLVERQVGDGYDSTSSRDQIVELTSDIFDAQLLENGVRCVCQMAYPEDAQPERCISCGQSLRARRLRRLARAEHVAPQWIRDQALGPFVAWKGGDEYGHDCWIMWSKSDLWVFGGEPDASEESPYDLLTVLGKGFPDIDAEALLAVLEVELVGVFEFDLDEQSVKAASETPILRGRSLIYHGVSVRWEGGDSEMFRYPTRELAVDAARFQFVENAAGVRSAAYVGPRIDWGYLITFGWIFR